MPDEETVRRILNQILNRELQPLSTSWRGSLSAAETEEDTISRGLSILTSMVPQETHGILHGWIDQAMLEIIATESIEGLRDRAKDYRPEQGGDSGVLVAHGDKILVLEFAFERGEASLCHYEPNRAPEPTDGLTPGRGSV